MHISINSVILKEHVIQFRYNDVEKIVNKIFKLIFVNKSG